MLEFTHIRAIRLKENDRNAKKEVIRIFADERKMKILQLLSQSPSIFVSDVSRVLGVSESTVRRDLQDLEEQGHLKRTHGGAVAREISAFEPSLKDKSVFYQQQKALIARMAIDQIQLGETILLDSGTTTFELARQLPDMDLTVVTNSLPIAEELSNAKHIRLLVLGGELRTTTGALVGTFAERMLAQVNVDRLFLGTNGIDIERGITTVNAVEAGTKAAMVDSAREVILVADHSKVGQVHLVKVCELERVNTFLTDEELAPMYYSAMERFGIRVIVAGRQVEEMT